MELTTPYKIGRFKQSFEGIVAYPDPKIIPDPYYVIAESIDESKYDDITNNFSWSTVGIGHKDYQFVRNQIMLRTAIVGFDNLPSLEEKQVASEFYAVGPNDRIKVHTLSEQESFWKDFVNNMQLSRAKRWEAARMHISFNFNITDSIAVSKDTKDLSYDYLTYGIESYALDGVVGLFDYLDGTYSYSAGTSFSSYTSWNQTIHNKINNTLKYGIYG